MANYSLKQGYTIIEESKFGSDELRTFVKAYPNLSILFRGLNPVGGLKTLLGAIPEHITCSKVEKILCESVVDETLPPDIIEDLSTPCDPEVEAKRTSAEEDFKEEIEDEKPAKAEKSSDYHTWTGKQLKEYLRSNKLAKACKAKFGDLAKDHAIAFLDGLEGGAEKPAEEKPVKAEKKVEEIKPLEVEETPNYESMTPLQLFNECKKNGIKAKVKQPKEYYINLLTPAKEEEVDVEEDEWDEEDTKPVVEEKKGPEAFEDDEIPETPVKKKSSKKSKKTEAPKAEEKVKAEEDEDEDWDI